MIHDKAERRIWWQWIVATAAGWFLFMELEGSRSPLALVGLLLIATGQWLVLRPILKRAIWWLVATPIGFLLGGVIGGILGGLLQDTMDGVSSPFGMASVVPGRSVEAYLAGSGVVDLSVGVLLAAAQWLVLRADAVRAVLWLPLSTLSIALGWGLNQFVADSAFYDVSLVALLGKLGGTSLISVGTGMALVRSVPIARSGPASALPASVSASVPGLSPVVDFPLFPVATGKFIVLSICSFGIYGYYWCYQNWKRLRDSSGKKLSPFWRAVFAPLWGYSLFREIRDLATLEGISTNWKPTLQGALYVGLSAMWRLPDPWWLIAVLTFVPMIPVQQAAQRINDQRVSFASEDQNHRYSGWNIALIVTGVVFWMLVLAGLFLPE